MLLISYSQARVYSRYVLEIVGRSTYMISLPLVKGVDRTDRIYKCSNIVKPDQSICLSLPASPAALKGARLVLVETQKRTPG